MLLFSATLCPCSVVVDAATVASSSTTSLELLLDLAWAGPEIMKISKIFNKFLRIFRGFST